MLCAPQCTRTLLDLGLPPEPAKINRNILICGDADFAYSLALESSLSERGGVSLFASAYEPEDELIARYPHAAAAIETLSSRGVAVRCGVDARAISASFGDSLRFDRIVFNLPQSPPAPKARNQIQRHRALLRDFCGSAATALAPAGQLWITLLAGQGGTVLDPIQRAAGDTWMLQSEAAKSGLLITDVHSADLDVLEASGYTPTGRRGGGALGTKRKSKGLVVHVLRPERQPGVGSSSDGAAEEDAGEPCSVAPFEHTLDNSFWVEGETEPTLTELRETAASALPPEARHALIGEPTLVDAYARPEDGRRARTYRFVYRSSVLALHKERALSLNAKVCAALSEAYSAEYRNPKPPAQQPGAEASGVEADEEEGDESKRQRVDGE